jgi:hypothetical protein
LELPYKRWNYLTNHDTFITEIIARYGDLLSKFQQYRRKCEVDQTSKDLPKQPRYNLDKIKVPQFSGNIKNYRTWKRIFEDTMKRNYENEGSQLARLIKAIPPNAKPGKDMKLNVLLYN